MKCPICGSDTKVINSRPNQAVVTRQRECLECLTRFNTREVAEIQALDPFLQDRLAPKILESSGGKGKWTKKETDFLIAMCTESVSHKEIAKALNRSYHGVAQRIALLRKKGILGGEKIES
jgi:transcriptional regulator NrdR family protein